MAKVNFVVRSAKGRIRNVSRKPTLGEQRFREVFDDARRAGPMPGNATDPVSLLHVSRVLEQTLRSTGGRPALAGADETPMRVSLMEGDRSEVEAITNQISQGSKLRPSPAQVVAVLCHLALRKLSRSDIEKAAKELRVGRR